MRCIEGWGGDDSLFSNVYCLFSCISQYVSPSLFPDVYCIFLVFPPHTHFPHIHISPTYTGTFWLNPPMPTAADGSFYGAVPAAQSTQQEVEVNIDIDPPMKR